MTRQPKARKPPVKYCVSRSFDVIAVGTLDQCTKLIALLDAMEVTCHARELKCYYRANADLELSVFSGTFVERKGSDE